MPRRLKPVHRVQACLEEYDRTVLEAIAAKYSLDSEAAVVRYCLRQVAKGLTQQELEDARINK